jgi:chromosomal replication initiator protein
VDNINDLLNKAKDLLKEETTEITYATWINPLEIKSFNDNTVILIASTSFQKDTLESKYLDLITNTFNFITNKKCKVVIKLENEALEDETPENNNVFANNTNLAGSGLKSGLNPKYTFDTFVVGNNNRFAQAAAMGVAENPGSKWNPFFIFGGVGLGKTHLMHAIGNEVLKQNPNASILYISSESFTNQLINALRDQSMDKFRDKYRNIDVLLIDDIQFIAGKKSTQEEFFNTFNALYDAQKQIILSSDRPPREIDLLDDRIKSRLEWGITADIQSPDYETRLAILRKKIQLESIIIDDEILSLIATKVDSNIRELEGIINKLIAKASLTETPITIEMAQKAIDDIKGETKVISSAYIQDVVAKYYNISVNDLKGQKRSADVTFPRQIAMYLCRNVAQMSMPQIGRDFGNRDHSTVMHACDKIEKEIKSNETTKLIVESVKNLLLSNK